MNRVLLLLCAGLALGAGSNARVEVCHLPPGDAGNYHTLTIPAPALPAHLAHGDLAGPCSNACGLLCNTHSKCFQDTGVFDPATGRCLCSSAPVDCAPASACFSSTGCDPSLGCQYQVQAGAACEADGNACTADRCDADGACQPGPHDLLAVGGTCSGAGAGPCAYDRDCPAGERCAWARPGPRFLDLGQGAVTDQRTCLMWEKKTTDGSGVQWVGRHFSWAAPGSGELTGTVRTELLDTLNAGAGLAGFTDWCLPTSAGDPALPTGQDPELESIRTPGCAVGPCIDAAFGPTEPGGFWTASTCAAVPFPPGAAWVVSFSELPPVVSLGTMEGGLAYARAVRSRGCPPAR